MYYTLELNAQEKDKFNSYLLTYNTLCKIGYDNNFECNIKYVLQKQHVY